MISLNIEKTLGFISKENVFAYEAQVKAAQEALENGTGKGNDFLGWLHLPSSITKEHLADLKATAQTLRDNCEVVVVAGIGGSYLGARAVIEALSNSFTWLQDKKTAPVILYAGHNIGEDYLYELTEYLKDKKFGVINISKSGTTTETALAPAKMKDNIQITRGPAMNFLHLKYFLLVAEELNITRAAERLYISQQSLSNHISNMEKELDVKLFTRSPKQSLTYAGDLLVETATQILDLHSQYLAKVGDINRHYMGLLRLGISHTCGLALLPDILPKFQAEFPMVEFSLFEGNSTHLEDELAHGRVDLIICFQPIMMEGVEVVPLTEEELILVVPKIFTDQLFGDRAEEVRAQFASGADIDVFQHQPFILIKRGNRTRNTVDQYALPISRTLL